MYALLDENKRITGQCYIDVCETGVELTPEIELYDTDEHATFFENGKFVRKNIFDLTTYKSKIKAQLYQKCKEEMETKNRGIDSAAIEAKIDCREIDILRVDQFVCLNEAKGATEQTLVSYILYDNKTKEVPLLKVKEAKNEMIETLLGMIYYKHSLYAKVESAETKAEIDLVTWDY